MYRKQVANVINCGYIAFMVAGMVLPLLQSKKRAKERGLRTLEAVGATLLVGQGLKQIVPELRPDGRDKTSFPSGHTAYSFAVAAISSQFEPKQAPLWYASALLIGIARVRLRRHFVWDVLAGGVIGIGAAYSQLVCDEGWLMRYCRHLWARKETNCPRRLQRAIDVNTAE